ncbi:unnamed protein product, partial [Closterium sp. Naga37s-1]
MAQLGGLVDQASFTGPHSVPATGDSGNPRSRLQVRQDTPVQRELHQQAQQDEALSEEKPAAEQLEASSLARHFVKRELAVQGAKPQEALTEEQPAEQLE